MARLRGYRSVRPETRFAKAADAALKLDWNEATVPPSPLVFERLSAFLAEGRLNRYADPTAHALRRQLVSYTGRTLAEIQVFNGSDSALDYVVRTFVGDGDHVVICAPCYDNVRVFVEALGAEVEQVLGPKPSVSNVVGLRARIRPATKLVYISNPNNPTGRMYTLAEIEKILRRLTRGVLIVDEAYFEFAGVTAAPLLDKYHHLVIARSFSKAFGLAGLRCGYTLASPRIMRHVNRIRNGKDVNALAQIAAGAALDDLDYMRAYVEQVRRSRMWLVKALRSRGYEVMPSPANFILVNVDAPADWVARLRGKGIYVRDRSYLPQLGRTVRITVGTEADARQLMAALDAVEADGRGRRLSLRG